MRGESRLIICLLLCAAIAFILYFNCGVYYNPVMVSRGNHIPVNRDVLEQLKFLKGRMHAGAALDMQKVYPEGYVFMQALYGLTWCDVADALQTDKALYAEAIEEVDWSCWNMRSKEAKRPFDQSLPLPYGAFYCGWSNYLLGRKLLAEGGDREQSDVEDFRTGCAGIADFFRNNATPYPESYRESSWPADAVMCVASLAIHDRIFKPLYGDVINTWLKRVRGQVDSIGLIPHSVEAATGIPLEQARGSSQCLMLNFLWDIDQEFAREQFDIFKQRFPDKCFGLYGIREYPRGISGTGDVDSGPVVFQIGAAASIVGMRTLNTYGEKEHAASLRNGIEAFGFPVHQSGAKMYLFGKLPMADVFIAWAHAKAVVFDKELRPFEHSFTWFHFYSSLIIAGCVILLIILLRQKKIKQRPHLRIS